jgi:uncharacterized delta-60 repeat protein
MNRHRQTFRPTVEILETRSMLAAGDLDTSFGIAGRVTTDFLENSLDRANAMAIQADGKIVVVGTTSQTGNGKNFAIARYLPDGNLDTSFSYNGRVTTDFAGQDDEAYGVIVQGDGKIIVAGRAKVGSESRFAVARYLDDGDLDFGFGNYGQALTNLTGFDEAFDIALQPDGKIVVAGGTWKDIALARYLPNGTVDPDFDNDGLVTTPISFPGGDDAVARAVAIQADGKIVIAGTVGEAYGNIVLGRYLSDGSLDETFGDQGGIIVSGLSGNDVARDVALQNDGRIVVVGTIAGNVGLARYLPDGTLDPDFHADGWLTTDLGVGNSSGQNVAIQSNGKIIAVGTAGFNGPSLNMAVTRYHPDGTLDDSFDDDGKLGIAFGQGDDFANAVAIQADGRIVVAGTTDANGDEDFALVRVLGKSVSVFIDKAILHIIADATANRIDIVDDGRGSVTVFDSTDDLGRFVGVASVIVQAGSGNDRISYRLDGSGEPLDLEVDLGSGDDVLTIDAAHIRGDAESAWRIRVDAGSGNDDVRCDLQWDAENRAQLDATIFGNDGDDWLGLSLVGLDHQAILRALIDGGSGFDTADISEHVTTFNIETHRRRSPTSR